MSRVDFAFGAPHRLRMACDVVRKQYLAGRRIVVYSRDAQALARFDRLLWGFDAAAFVPHVMADDPLADDTPVVLCSTPPLPAGLNASRPDSPAAWLLNLDTDCPPDANSFERVLEIVSNDEHDKAAGRERWRQYQAAGHDVRAHDVSAR
jgi:DNA polymerase-3 subunit chi